MPEGPPGLPATSAEPLTQPHNPNATPADATPTRAGCCRIVGEVGRGGMGLVYEGEDEALGRRLAVKVLHRGLLGREGVERRFLAEARLTGQLQHPGVPPIHEVGTLPDGRPFFSMKLVRGRTLEALLRDRASPADDLPRFITIFESVCQTIAYAHSRGILHRDIKPSNVMVGEFGEVQVMDWGLAKQTAGAGVREDHEGDESTALALAGTVPADATSAGTVLGTPAYLAPEQARGQSASLDQRADVFGLGALLCKILTNKPPYTADGNTPVLRQAQEGDLSAARRLIESCGADPEMIRLCLACLEFQPSRRPPDAAAVAASVAAHRAGVEERLRQAQLERAAAEARADEEAKRRRLVMGLAGLALALLLITVGVGGWLYSHRARVGQAIEASLAEADHFSEGEKWREGLDAATRARDQAADWLVAGPLRQRAEEAWREQTLIAELDRLLMVQAEVDLARNRFNPLPALAGYRKAFAAAGCPLDGAASAASAWLAGRRGKVRERVTEGLYDWWGAATGAKTPEAGWLDEALEGADGGAWAGEMRRAFRAGDRAAMVRVASTADPGLPPGILLMVAAGLKKVKEEGRALALLERLHGQHPGRLWVLVALAEALSSAAPARPAEAARVYAAAAALRPGSVGLWHNLAISLDNAGDPEGAVRAAEKATLLEPRYAAAQANLARVLLPLRRLPEAERAARKALEADDVGAYTWQTLAVVLLAKGDRPGAEAALARALRQATDSPADWENLYLDNTAHFKNPVGAANALRRLLTHQPDNAQAWMELGSAYASVGRRLEAASAARRAAELAPTNAAAWANLSTALTGIRSPAEADQALARAAALGAADAAAHAALGKALMGRGRHVAAALAYREATRLAPRDDRYWERLSLSLKFAGAQDDALAAIREAIRLAPDYHDYHSIAGTILCDGKKDFDAAAAMFREAIRLAPPRAGPPLQPRQRTPPGREARGGDPRLHGGAPGRPGRPAGRRHPLQHGPGPRIPRRQGPRGHVPGALLVRGAKAPGVLHPRERAVRDARRPGQGGVGPPQGHRPPRPGPACVLPPGQPAA